MWGHGSVGRHPPSTGRWEGRAGLARARLREPSLAYLAALSYPLSVHEGETFIQRLRMPTRWAKVVRDTIVVRAQFSADSASPPTIGGPDLTAAQLSVTLDQLSPSSAIQVNALMTDSPTAKEALDHYLTTLRYVKPSLSGKDLLSMGVAQGPLVGKILRELKAARIEGRVATRQEEVRMARGLIQAEGG